jgi:outer membrane biosynthesis protein TonB
VDVPMRDHTPTIDVPPPMRSDVHIVGGLSAEVIRRAVRRHTNEVRHCYERALSTEPDLAGRVTVQFIVAPNGAVQSSAVVPARTDLGSGEVSDCVAGTVQRWSFPTPDGGGVVSVTYPFVFSAS